MNQSPVELVLHTIDALDRCHVQYMTVGSFSSNVYGNPRSTKDADFVIELGSTDISSIASAIGPDFDLDAQMSFETVTATTRYRVKHRATVFMIEFFLLSTDPHDHARFARRVKGDIGGRSVYVPTAEDVIITKVRWSKHGNRQKDIDDVLDVLVAQSGKLDLTYIRHWCDIHGTRGSFEKLLEEVSASS